MFNTELALSVREQVVTEFEITGRSKELGYWIFDGIVQDIEEEWDEDRYFRWVRYGELAFGFTLHDHDLINELTKKAAKDIHKSNASSFN